MRTAIVMLCVLLAGCGREVPPEAVGPVAKVCEEHGMRIRVSHFQITCFKGDE